MPTVIEDLSRCTNDRIIDTLEFTLVAIDFECQLIILVDVHDEDIIEVGVRTPQTTHKLTLAGLPLSADPHLKCHCCLPRTDRITSQLHEVRITSVRHGKGHCCADALLAGVACRGELRQCRDCDGE